MREIIFSICLILTSILVYVGTTTFSSSTGRLEALGPSFFPLTLAVVLASFAVLILIQSLRSLVTLRGEKREIVENGKRSSADNLRVFLVFLSIVGYCICLFYLGYLLSTTLFLVVVVSLMTEKVSLKATLFRIVPLSLGIAMVTYAVFHLIIRIPLPESLILTP